MFAYYLRVEKVFLENKKAHTGQIKGITAGLKPPEKQKKFDTFTVSNLIYYNGGAEGIRTLAPVNQPTSLAGKPLEPLEYYSTLTSAF